MMKYDFKVKGSVVPKPLRIEDGQVVQATLNGADEVVVDRRLAAAIKMLAAEVMCDSK
ncbi:hypothetical protein [Secundilactobacillus similis]|uniref:hypothetical protein n=1 Tax=Secundilactobacillus similis TaxID=414682 RepID=UPI000B067E6A|nr:hypothetical protein [Secundilactobacillus similis]